MAAPITPDLIYELISYSSPSLSPDGSTLAFAQSKTDKDTMETCSRVMLQRLPDGEARAFTAGPKDGGPKFSPDGRSVAFTRPGNRGRAQVWVIGLSGGEARQVTELEGGIAEFAWSPDSGALAVVSEVDPDRPADDHDYRKDPRVRVARRLTYRADTVGWRGAARRHIFIVDINGGAARRLTEGDWDSSGPVWSPDGSKIAFISARRADRETVPYNEVYVAPAAGGEAVCRSEGLTSVGAVAWSPDGAALAVVGGAGPEVSASWQGRIFILRPGEPPRQITGDELKPGAGMPLSAPAPEFVWTDNGALVFLGDAEGESYVCRVPVNTGAARRVTGGGVQYSAISIDAGAAWAVTLAMTPSSPGDLDLVDLHSGETRRLTHGNDAYLSAHPPAILRKSSLQRAGYGIQSRMLLPPDFNENNKYPLALDVHGGPHGVFADGFNATQQVLATSGYIVLAVNPRGSSTYGAEFLKAVLADWGGEDYLDIMAAVDEACALPYVDETRLGVHGYSYGGFMSSWIIGHDTRFGAAVVGAPCIDLLSMYGTSDIGVSFGERQWGGPRHKMIEAYLEHSPISYADRVETPVLLLHGEADHRCPIEQSEQYFVALKRLGKEVELARFPGCSHLFVRAGHPKMREEYLVRTLDWFDRRLKG